MNIIGTIKLSRARPGLPTAILWDCAVFLLAYFIKSPALAAESVRGALGICASRLIPSLFPFIVLTGIVSSSGLADAAAEVIGRPFERLFGISRSAACAFLMGAVGGFPVGAIMARGLYDDLKISRSEAERLICFTNNAGLAFCVGGIGVSLYGSAAVGWQIYLCQLTAAMLIGIVQSIGSEPSEAQPEPIRRRSPGELLGRCSESIAQGGLTMLKICAFAVFFAVIGDALTAALDASLGRFAAALGASFCELTLASRLCAGLGRTASLPMCAFAVGFAGLSVHMQVAAVLGGKIPMRRYLFSKLAQGIISALLMMLACLFIAR